MGYVNEILLIAVLIFSLVSCKQGDGIYAPANDDINHIIDAEPSAKIYLSEASSQQLESLIDECPSNPKDHKQCFLICHVPPGNPKNSHSLIVPLPAVNAHMNHGHQKNAQIQGQGKGKDKDKDKGKGDKEYRGDYMGACDGSGTGGTTGGTTDGGSTGGTDGSTTGGTTGGTTDGSTTGGTTGTTDGGTTGGTAGSTTGTTGSTDGGTTGGTSGGTTGGDPIFCEWTLEIDLDCDGYNDQTGEPIF